MYTDDGSTLEFDISIDTKCFEKYRRIKSKDISVCTFRHVIDILTDKLRSEGITTEYTW